MAPLRELYSPPSRISDLLAATSRRIAIAYGRAKGVTVKTVANILTAKGHDIYQVAPDTSVFEALQIMADNNVGALVVMEGGTLVGILSERDYARKVVLEDRRSPDTPVSQIMTDEVTTVGPESPVEECMELMTERHIRHLPVVKDDQLVGVISIGDVVKTVIADLAALVDQLDSYIRGG
jgi:CBS domain-containing protein